MAAIVEIIQEPWLMKQIAIENVVEIQMSTAEAMSILQRVTTLFMELEGHSIKIVTCRLKSRKVEKIIQPVSQRY